MAELASLTAAGGVVGDEFFDDFNLRHVVSRVFTSGVYAWSTDDNNDADVSEGVGILDIGTVRIMWQSVTNSVDTAQTVTMPDAFADTNYSIFMTPMDPTGTVSFGATGVGFYTQFATKTTTTFVIDRDNDVDGAYELGVICIGTKP